jgi:hypothetical protein
MACIAGVDPFGEELRTQELFASPPIKIIRKE